VDGHWVYGAYLLHCKLGSDGKSTGCRDSRHIEERNWHDPAITCSILLLLLLLLPQAP
jgi:hypothetical protein